MRKIIGRLPDGAVIESVVVSMTNGQAEHRYRILGGSTGVREFATLRDLAHYLSEL